MNTTDLIEQFADGESVSPDALIVALATQEGREHLRGVLELRALMADRGLSPASRGLSPNPRGLSPNWRDRPLPFSLRIAAAAFDAIAAAAGGYLAGNRQAISNPREAVERIEPPPAPTTVIKLDATHGWRDQSGGF